MKHPARIAYPLDLASGDADVTARQVMANLGTITDQNLNDLLWSTGLAIRCHPDPRKGDLMRREYAAVREELARRSKQPAPWWVER